MESKSREKVIGISRVGSLLKKDEIRNSLYSLLDEMKNRNKITIPPQGKVMIKPNICLVKCCESGTTVDPYVVQCLVDWLLSNYEIETIYIGEADATQLDIEIAFKVLGWETIFNDYDQVKLLNITKDDLVDVELENGLFFKNLKMSRAYMESDFLISVAKLKTHTMTTITGILKNQYGANPVKYKLQYHPNLDEVICDLNMVRPPDLCLIDGLIAMEGEGPISGIPKPMGLLISGDDGLATDHASALIMGFDPNHISHLKLALNQEVGSYNYNVFGESIEQVKTSFLLVPRWKKLITGVYNNEKIHKIPVWKSLVSKLFRG